MSRLLLLPSARLVPPELQTEFGSIPSAMVPVDGRPALLYIAEPYMADGYDVLVSVGENGDHVRRYLSRNPQFDIGAIDVGATGSLGETVLRSLDSLADVPEHLIINFADTFVGERPLGENVVCFSEPEDNIFRWTTFKTTDDDRLTDVVDKLSDKEGRTAQVFVGVFAIGDVPAFRDALYRSLTARGTQDPDPFYAALTDYFNGLPKSARTFQKVEDWRDFGHLDTYYETKRAFWINKRFFNEISVDGRRGTIRKTSKNVDKFIDEVRWYLKLPKGLQHLAPRVFDYDLNITHPFVELEYYGYPTLNDMYLYGEYDDGVWRQVLAAISHAVKAMRDFRVAPTAPEKLTEAMREMYEVKTRERLAAIVSDERFARFCDDRIRINGRTHPGLPRVLERLDDVIEQAGLYAQPFFSIIHGDFCLSNVLFDRRNCFIRLIDPRGGFGFFDLYGDPRYDLAKLCHSFEGDYDFFLNGLFDLEWRGGELRYEPHLDTRHLTVKRRFHAWMQENWADEYRGVKLIESLLFLSMIPLHDDRFESQQAFLARGIELFSQWGRGG